MQMVDNVLSAASESDIEENWHLLYNQLTCNDFINRKYLWSIRDDTDGQYMCVPCNAGVTYTNKIGELPG